MTDTIENYLQSNDLTSNSYSQLLTQKHIDSNPNIERLDISNNKNITDISKLTKLKWLCITGNAVLKQIENKDLETLNLSGNKTITDISKLQKLKVLNISFTSLTSLPFDTIEELNMNYNNKLVDLSQAKKLKKVEAIRTSLYDVNLENLVYLNVSYCSTFEKNIDNAKQLKILYAEGNCGIKYISSKTLERLNISSNNLIRFLSLPNLKMLIARTSSILTNIDCPELKLLDITNNTNFTSFNTPKLEILIACGNSKIFALTGDTLTYLDVSNNKYTYFDESLVNLKTLVARNTTRVNTFGKNLIERLDIRGNNNFMYNGPVNKLKEFKCGAFKKDVPENRVSLKTLQYWDSVFNDTINDNNKSDDLFTL